MGQRLVSRAHPVQAVSIDGRPHCSKPLHEVLKPVPRECTVGAVAEAEVFHGPDEVLGVPSPGIYQPGVAAPNNEQVDFASTKICYEICQRQFPIHFG